MISIKKLVVLGPTYQRTLEFNDGLNIISGERTSGKSLVLSLIDYCLGKSGKINLKVQKELAEHIDQVYLEITINDMVYTIYKKLKSHYDKFWIYYTEYAEIEDFIPDKKDRKEYLSFLVNKIGAIDYEKTKSKPNTKELTTQTVSFRDMFRYSFVNQHDLGTHHFLANTQHMKKINNPIAFELIFDLIDYNHKDIQIQIKNKTNEIIGEQKKIDSYKDYLDARDYSDFDLLNKEIEKISIEIDQYKFEVKEIINRDVSERKNVPENKEYIKITNELLLIDKKRSTLSSRIQDLEYAILSNEILRKEYQSEMNDIKVTEEANLHLHLKQHKLICPLCDSLVHNSFDENKSKVSLEKSFMLIESDIKSKMKLVERVIETNKTKVSELRTERKKQESKRDILNLALTQYVNDLKTPYLSHVNSLNLRIGNLEKNKTILNENLKVHNSISSILIQKDKLEDQLEKLKGQLTMSADKSKRKKLAIEDLERRYLENMRAMKYKDYTETRIDANNYTPYFQDSSVYEHESGGLLICMQLSFLEAIASSQYSSYHTGVLMFDSLSKYFGTIESKREENVDLKAKDLIQDPEVFLEVFKLLVNVENGVQSIVVENTPPAQMEPYVIYTFLNGDRGYIDLDKNELL